MITTKIEVSTRKGEKQVTTWGIWQNRPFPDIEGGGGLRWRNGEGLFGQFGRPAEGLGQSYRAVLLREGWTPETSTGDRRDYAGYVDYRTKETAPGAIVLRGRYMGETSAEIDTREHGRGVWFKVNGFDNPTQGEREFLRDQVEPGLLAAIAANREALKAEAVAGIAETVKKLIEEARVELVRMEKEAEKAIAAL